MMVIGETIAAGVAGTNLVSPWFEALGDGATFALECVQFLPGAAMAELTITVQTKATEDDDASAATVVPMPEPPWKVDRIGVSQKRYVGFSELVRFQYSFSPVAPEKNARMHFRMLPPLWEGNRLCCELERALAKQVEVTF